MKQIKLDLGLLNETGKEEDVSRIELLKVTLYNIVMCKSYLYIVRQQAL